MNPVQLNVSQSLLVLSGERGVRSYATLRRDPVTSGAGALRATVGPPMVVETTAKENTMTVTVHNHLLSKGTSIHFHGIHQHMTPWYDGVPGLSQNPIPPGNSMTYAGFAAHPVGTHYYHSHTGLESASGVHGPLIIKSPPGKDPHKKSYDRDQHRHHHHIYHWKMLVWYYQGYQGYCRYVYGQAPRGARVAPPASRGCMG